MSEYLPDNQRDQKIRCHTQRLAGHGKIHPKNLNRHKNNYIQLYVHNMTKSDENGNYQVNFKECDHFLAKLKSEKVHLGRILQLLETIFYKH
ncbi:MAG: hypothetical protein IPG79_05610 [Saprospiraceae bacterium]|nr:hypothetical protein [Saprospiraceae bacterium]MBP6693648.1 hypothetical protein [Saprospiraceae bacterium]